MSHDAGWLSPGLVITEYGDRDLLLISGPERQELGGVGRDRKCWGPGNTQVNDWGSHLQPGLLNFGFVFVSYNCRNVGSQSWKNPRKLAIQSFYRWGNWQRNGSLPGTCHSSPKTSQSRWLFLDAGLKAVPFSPKPREEGPRGEEGRAGRRNSFSILPSQLHLVGPSRKVSSWKEGNPVQPSNPTDTQAEAQREEGTYSGSHRETWAKLRHPGGSFHHILHNSVLSAAFALCLRAHELFALK